MHIRTSNSKLVEPLPEPERTLNQRLRRRNMRVPLNQRNNPPQNPRFVYPPILNISHFHYFLVILENLYPMDDEPMWAAYRFVAPTPGSAITIPETENEFSIKEDMEFESTNSGTTAKLPILKLGMRNSAQSTQRSQNGGEVRRRQSLSAMEREYTEDLNLKFLSSLAPEWNTHVVVWMNKPEVDTMSIDDLYNNFKIVEQKKAYLVEYQDYNGGPVAFGGSKGQITGKGKIITRKLDFEDVYFVKELKQFNLFSVSQMCDKKNKVLFTDSECLVLSPDFKLPDENQVLLRVPRQNNMYSFNLENIVPTGGLACLIAKATVDESNKWHRRLGHVNFKNLNKLVKGNLVRGLPSKIFQNDHTCVACQKGKQHKASCKAKVVSSISQPLQLLHMDLFGPTSDETNGILKDFIRQIENQLNQKVKTIRCDNGTEFKNRDIIEFYRSKGIKREYSNAKTPQQMELLKGRT
ncbi:putative ribonuclease H-like domain-containing protein [Tanacetum coccineum]